MTIFVIVFFIFIVVTRGWNLELRPCPIRYFSLDCYFFVSVFVSVQPQDHELLFTRSFLVLVWVNKVFSIKLVQVSIIDHIPSIHLIVGDWVAECFEMDSDLVSTACFWKTFYQRMAALLVEMKKLEQCRGSSRLRPMLEGNIFRFGAVPECFNVGYTIDAKVTRDCQFLRGLLCLFSISLVFTIICRGLTSLSKVSLNARIVNFSNFVSN